MRPRDVAKLGQLVLGHGKWNGKRLVSREWIETSARLAVERPPQDGYGLHWWLGRSDRPGAGEVAWVAGVGTGGQRLFVVLDLVVVIMGGLYDHPKQAAIVRDILETGILTELK